MSAIEEVDTDVEEEVPKVEKKPGFFEKLLKPLDSLMASCSTKPAAVAEDYVRSYSKSDWIYVSIV